MNDQPKTPGAMVLMPREPTPEMVGLFNEMLESVDDGCLTSSKDLLAKLIGHIGAEQAPAGGVDIPTLRYMFDWAGAMCCDGPRNWRVEVDRDLPHPDFFKDGQAKNLVELIDRANVAPLLAEIERLNGMLDASSELFRAKQRVNRQLTARIAELEAQQGEPVAWMNTATGHVTTSPVVVMDWDDEKEHVQSLYRQAQPATADTLTAECLHVYIREGISRHKCAKCGKTVYGTQLP